MSRRTTLYDRPRPTMGFGTVAVIGLGAGIVGVACMTLGEKIEQFITKRPSSYVPGHTLERLLGYPWRPDSQITHLNWGMHYGQGALAAVIRATMSLYGIRGPFADFMFVGIRLLIDQTLENWTGVGALPWTWPANEQIIDIVHKGVFAFVTGWVCDAYIQ
ncbi:hypothetical protein OE88DRAFT_1627406 [Heliocybe sulcata]|uniref:DUF1440 domain-containing protein n=1 Tax=Heliocybe sulcata TaxID=5364 RepID=A0A5C3N5D6_9AGAM|nr:hypothetical protein OE88DRAFT_1627406 [Heliocybe sulcata]